MLGFKLINKLCYTNSPEMFDEVAPTSQLYESNEADAQTTLYVAKELDDEKISDVITDSNEEKKKSDVEPEDVKDNDLKQSDESRKIYKVFI